MGKHVLAVDDEPQEVPTTWVIRMGECRAFGPEVVIVWNHEVFAALAALSAVGLAFSDEKRGVRITRGSRHVSVAVTSAETIHASRGFRTPRGDIYLPIQLLHREGLYSVRVEPDRRLIQLSTEPPPEEPAATS